MISRVPRAKFVAAPGVLVDGQETDLRCDATGALVVTAGGAAPVLVAFTPPLSFNSAGVLQDSAIIRATPGTLLDVNGFNNSVSQRFFQLFNLVAVPADTTVPLFVIPVPPTSTFSFSFADSQGMSLSTGAVWASSSTLLTLTITLAADMLINAQHRDP